MARHSGLVHRISFASNSHVSGKSTPCRRARREEQEQEGLKVSRKTRRSILPQADRARPRLARADARRSRARSKRKTATSTAPCRAPPVKKAAARSCASDELGSGNGSGDSRSQGPPSARPEAIGVAAPTRHAVESDERRERVGDADDKSFVGTNTKEDEAKELGEEFVRSVTSGEEAESEMEEEEAVEEEGGPFVVTSASTEYGFGTDESNPADAEKAPFPQVSQFVGLAENRRRGRGPVASSSLPVPWVQLHRISQ